MNDALWAPRYRRYGDCKLCGDEASVTWPAYPRVDYKTMSCLVWDLLCGACFWWAWDELCGDERWG